VLSNATTISNPIIKEALLKVDQNILKLDSAFDSTIKIHNQPKVEIKVEELIKNLHGFNGNVIIQTLFLRGTYNGKVIDNTTPVEINEWLKAIKRIKPVEVMIYTISRDTPHGASLKKIPVSELKKIALMVESIGVKTRVPGNVKKKFNILICPLEWGLGHAARMIPLARCLRDMDNNITIASGEEHLSLFRNELPGLSYINFTGFKPSYSRFLPQYLSLFLKSLFFCSI